MVRYRLLALDLDDTVLTSNKEISVENKKWITNASEAGVIVIFATGRGLQRVEELRIELNLNTPMVLVNGAEIWKKPGKLLNRFYISRSDIRLLHKLAEQEKTSYWGYSADSLTGKSDWTEDMFNQDWTKFGMRHHNIETINLIKEKIKASSTLEVTGSAPDNIEVSLKGISKKSGVELVCEHLNINMNEVMAIGDNLNDLQLICSAGLGVAMGNSDQALKEVADKVTDTNENDGVAKAIKRYLFNIA